MLDQSFCRSSLERLIVKHDFLGVPPVDQVKHKTDLLNEAVASSNLFFSNRSALLNSFPVQRKPVYEFRHLADEVVCRKVTQNLKFLSRIRVQSRLQISINLRRLLEEGVPYRVYRLDIQKFYESFTHEYVLNRTSELGKLSPQSKRLIQVILSSQAAIGGQGVPRGLTISAALAEFLMQKFDDEIRSNAEVFFFARYVDDIVVITSARERINDFLRDVVEKSLPVGLELNPRKRKVQSISERISKSNSGNALLGFECLGYRFSVRNPTDAECGKKNANSLRRVASVDIAMGKVKKIKTRIVRSFLDLSKNKDFGLLRDRIAYLTQNFSVFNPKAGSKKIAGIYFSYPLVDLGAPGLLALDAFLRNAILSKAGRVFSESSKHLTGDEKRQLLHYSFSKGHREKSFIHFSGQRISDIQRCWKY